MRVLKSLAVVAVLTGVSTANGAIIPSWRINTITPEQIAASGGQLTSASISVSLMVELTGNSLFNFAGLDLNGPAAGNASNIRYFHRSGGGATDTDLPDLADVANSPAEILNIDTRVSTAVRGEAASAPIRLNGSGAAQLGKDGLTPTSGSNRVGSNFNVAWSAIPNNGGPGIFEIATITFASGVLPGLTPLGIGSGFVGDSLSPNSNVALPPIPVNLAIPEPTSLAIAGLGLLALRRQ